MNGSDRDRAKALGQVLAEDIAECRGLTLAELPAAWHGFAEGIGLFVLTRHELDRIACTGALIYAAAHLPPLPDKVTG